MPGDRPAGPEPPLYPASSAGGADIVAQWADSALFWTAVPYTMQPAGAAHIFEGAPPELLKAFREDRAAMTAGMRRPGLADPVRSWRRTAHGSTPNRPTGGHG